MSSALAAYIGRSYARCVRSAEVCAGLKALRVHVVDIASVVVHSTGQSQCPRARRVRAAIVLRASEICRAGLSGSGRATCLGIASCNSNTDNIGADIVSR